MTTETPRFQQAEIARRATGTRRVAGTDWPVVTIVERVTVPLRARPEWRVTHGLCNGTADGVTTYRTRRAALDAVIE